MTALIEARGLSVRFGGQTVLYDVDLEVEAGEIVTVVGPNGSGKTTLIRALIGAVPAHIGMVRHADGLRIGYVPQLLSIDRTMPLTVASFLALAEKLPTTRLKEALRTVGAENVLDSQLAELSGGEFQRVILARAILRRPNLLVLDEPTKGLDQSGVAEFYRLIETLRTELEAAVLMVSHDLHVVMRASDRVICVNGHICCQGAPTTVSRTPEYRALFGAETAGTLALYRHEHDHSHDHSHDDGCGHGQSTSRVPPPPEGRQPV
jgi:zinc transport system ATP-binding protein